MEDIDDKYRVWASVSFAVMLIVFGVPVWWKTTEVYRAPLPYSTIHQLDINNMTISMDILIYTKFPTLFNTIRSDLQYLFRKTRLFSIGIEAYKMSSDNFTIEEVEEEECLSLIKPGQLLLLEVPYISEKYDIVVSSRRVIYFTSIAKSETIGRIISNWMLEENELTSKMRSILVPNISHPSADEGFARRLPAALGYDLLFTVVNSDPSNINLEWDLKQSIKRYIEPLLEQISEIGMHMAKSQWLYLINLKNLMTHLPEKQSYVIKFEDLPHIITPLEKRLGTGVSAVRCIQMVLYITNCDRSPLSFLSETGVLTSHMVAPSWGAVQILNPTSESCENATVLKPNSQQIMSTFIALFHQLLGFSNKERVDRVHVLRRKGPYLLDWELDSLYRMRCVEQLTSAALTLQSLAKLLGEISNIVINEEVAGSVSQAVSKLQEGMTELHRGDLQRALQCSSQAFSHAEKAFSGPSLLALLYFPDDQKYAVYIPLFLPIMIPVLMSLGPIYRWYFKHSSAVSKKES